MEACRDECLEQWNWLRWPPLEDPSQRHVLTFLATHLPRFDRNYYQSIRYQVELGADGQLRLQAFFSPLTGRNIFSFRPKLRQKMASLQNIPKSFAITSINETWFASSIGFIEISCCPSEKPTYCVACELSRGFGDDVLVQQPKWPPFSWIVMLCHPHMTGANRQQAIDGSLVCD